MSDTKIYYGQQKNIGCDVQNCKYNTSGHHCAANHIEVQSENAMRKAETFCGTFTPRAGL